MADDGEVELRGHADALALAVADALPRWVERCVDRVYRAWNGPPPAAVTSAAAEAGRAARADIGPRVRDLLARDIDEQSTTPLALLREGTRYPTRVLQDAGVPGVERDPMDQAMFPDDTYGLGPASFAEVDPALGDLGLTWGAAKAWVHRRRHG